MYCTAYDVELRESPVGVGAGEIFTDGDDELDWNLCCNLRLQDKQEVSTDEDMANPEC